MLHVGVYSTKKLLLTPFIEMWRMRPHSTVDSEVCMLYIVSYDTISYLHNLCVDDSVYGLDRSPSLSQSATPINRSSSIDRACLMKKRPKASRRRAASHRSSE